MYFPYFNYDYGYGYNYGAQQSNPLMGILIAGAIGTILGLAIFFFVLPKKNEKKYTGFRKKIFDFFNFNKFYLEDIVKLIYVMSALAVTAIGIYLLFSSFVSGILVLVIGNIALRLSCELITMFAILCKKTVSVDRKMDKVSKFYEKFEEDEEVEEAEDVIEINCDGNCEACEAKVDEINFNCDFVKEEEEAKKEKSEETKDL